MKSSVFLQSGLEAETKAKFNHLIEKVFSINFPRWGRVPELGIYSTIKLINKDIS